MPRRVVTTSDAGATLELTTRAKMSRRSAVGRVFSGGPLDGMTLPVETNFGRFPAQVWWATVASWWVYVLNGRGYVVRRSDGPVPDDDRRCPCCPHCGAVVVSPDLAAWLCTAATCSATMRSAA